MRRNKLLQALVVASLATLAASAGAQNATPREPTPQMQPQNGSPVGGTPSTAPSINSQYNPNPQTWQSPPGSAAPMVNDQARTYLDARQACLAQPLAQQAACNDDVTSRFGAIDAKCQKLSGPALVDCVHGVDHGG